MSDNPLVMALGRSLPRLAERARVEKQKKEQIELGQSIQSIFAGGGSDTEKMHSIADMFASKGMVDQAVSIHSKASEVKYNREQMKQRLDRQQGQDYLNAIKNSGLKMTTKGFLSAWKDGVFDPSKVRGTDLVVNTKDGGKIFESSGWVLNEDNKKVFTEGVQVYNPGDKSPTYYPNRDSQGKIVEAKQPLTTEDWKARYQAKSDVQMKQFWAKEKSKTTNDFFNKYKGGINADRNESVSTLSEISSAIEKAPNRPATYGIITSIIARQLGKEVGALSEGDLKRVAGSQSVPARITRTFGKMIKGQALNPDDLTDFKDYIADSINIQKQFLLNDVESYSRSADAVSQGELSSDFLRQNLSQQLDFEFDLEQDAEVRRREITEDPPAEIQEQTFEEPTSLDEAVVRYKEITGREPSEKVLKKMRQKYKPQVKKSKPNPSLGGL